MFLLFFCFFAYQLAKNLKIFHFLKKFIKNIIADSQKLVNTQNAVYDGAYFIQR